MTTNLFRLAVGSVFCTAVGLFQAFGLAGCSSSPAATERAPDSLTTAYGNTVAKAEVLPNGGLRSTLTDASGQRLAILTWSKASGGQIEMGAETLQVDLGEATPTEQGLNEGVRQLWMTSNKDSLPQLCTSKGDCTCCQADDGTGSYCCCYCDGWGPKGGCACLAF